MLRTFLLGKIHHARVTECKPEYSGSITIDRDLLDETGILPNEKVLVADCENGHRFETYVFEGDRGSGDIVINGAAARLTGLGHRVIVIAYCQLDRREMDAHRPRVIVCDADNRVTERITYPAPLEGGPPVVQAADAADATDAADPAGAGAAGAAAGPVDGAATAVGLDLEATGVPGHGRSNGAAPSPAAGIATVRRATGSA